ncbi:MAG: hypothetical protein ACYDC5_02920 [Candidatus Dormibacteria bacterium]
MLPRARLDERAFDLGRRPWVISQHAVPAAISLGLALGWLALSWWHPTITYHLGAPLVAAAWPIVLRARLRHRAARRDALLAAAGATLLALAGTAVATAAHLVDGPTLIGRGSPAVEAVVLAGRGRRLEVVSTTLRPATVAMRADSLIVFGRRSLGRLR